MTPWSRRAPSGQGYEVSTKGDRRFSALCARLPDGRTIEEAYQLDVKGYRSVTKRWKEAKGKPPLRPMGEDEIYEEYKELWRSWARHNPALMEELRLVSSGKTLTDMFAATRVSQARVLAELLDERPDWLVE